VSEAAGLVAASRRERLRTIREHEATAALAFALRRLLYTDRDANVRAAAARRLGDLLADSDPSSPSRIDASRIDASRIDDWLVDALDDRSALVRDAILRALARAGSPASAPAVRALVAGDRTWWIRRSAIYALAALAGAEEVPAFTAALGDPFWRVRHAAVKVLAMLGARDPEIRDGLHDVPASSTLAFLRSSWGPVAVEAPARAGRPSALPQALLDPDPAVVTARLATDRTVTPHALVELLCDPHEPLRSLAAERLAASGDSAALEAALDWLEEPRVPHVADTVEALVDGLGDLAVQLATRALARTDRPGAGRWALGWVVATRFEPLYPAAHERARRDPSLRRAALPLAGSGELVAWAAEDPTLAPAIAAELHARRAFDALEALDSHPPRVRALQIDAAARTGSWDRVDAAADDPHHGPRAIAARWLVRAGRSAARRFASDRDPAVREAAISPAASDAAVAVVLAHDPDPWVRRAALRAIVSGTRDARELTRAVVDAVVVAARDSDPVLRRQACLVPGVEPRVLACTVAAQADGDEMVRAAAAEGLEQLADADSRVRALLDGELPAAIRALAYGWLARRLDDAATELARAALLVEGDPRVRGVLAGVAGITLPATGEPLSEPREAEALPHPMIGERREAEALPRLMTEAPIVAAVSPPPAVQRRAFGRAGFSVAPLAISGAYDLAPQSLERAFAAGVDLYFWEPGYDRMTRFLRDRGARARVITGSYHADARSIRRDVDAALRVLRRDTLDAFLLFWTRSPARVDAAAFGVLDDLRRAGKLRAIGFSTHHRELAASTITSIPWDVVMIRHSAAHPGIESELLPIARATSTAIVTFSALTYGRMLEGPGAPTAAECYRYSLAQAGVTACISAPRRAAELEANLEALAAPDLPAERIAALRTHGVHVRAESQRFNLLLRQPTRDAAAAARELLASELAPEADATVAPRRSPVAAGRRSRARLGRRRR
jgi:HEAT repeat protein